MAPVLLVGMPGSGKTTLSLELGRRGYRVCDLDRVIEQDSGKEIFEIIRVEGIERFRDIEYLSLAKTIGAGYDFISAGGGLLTHGRSLQLARESSTVLCLVCTPDEIARRCFKAESDYRKSYTERDNTEWDNTERDNVGRDNVDARRVKCKAVRPLLVKDDTFTYQSIRRSVIALYYERLRSFAEADLFVASQFIELQELANVVIGACNHKHCDVAKNLDGMSSVGIAIRSAELDPASDISLGNVRLANIGLGGNEDRQLAADRLINAVTDVLLFDAQLYRILCETSRGGAANWAVLFTTIYELVKVENEVSGGSIDRGFTASGSSSKHICSKDTVGQANNGNVEKFYKRLSMINPCLVGTSRAYQLQWFVGACEQAGLCEANIHVELSSVVNGITGSVDVAGSCRQQASEDSCGSLINALARFHIVRPGVIVGEF